MAWCCLRRANRATARMYVPPRQAAAVPGAAAPQAALSLYAPPPYNTYHYALQAPAQPEYAQQTHVRAPSCEEPLPASAAAQAPAYVQPPTTVHPASSPPTSPFPPLPAPVYVPQQQLYPAAPAARPLSFDEAYSLPPPSPPPTVAPAPTSTTPFSQSPPPHYSQY
ncbi:hypothetical protein EXIGLDRAFT_370226 [Exidia glandulosa HHB12029]|uniref:Uncharacterized protein n=1 Tax=Exidia glandulosa HHB12029 TaxID=1314781 RepID=A0A165ZDF3_EXIGL|nr:hypothetical protein EXIGLDRAFT_370226 [Exidia glandulosa HHB12029]